MSWQPTAYALIPPAGALAPVLVGSYAWQRRGKPGATALAVLSWILALWGVLYTLELGRRDGATALLFYEVEAALLPLAAPLWLIFVFRYTGRERWLKRSLEKALLFTLPVATLVLAGGNLAPAMSYDPLLWFDFAYATLLVLAGAALLVLMLANSQSLYAKQSLCLLLGFVGPWTAHVAYVLGLYPGPLPGLDPMLVAFVPAGLAFACGFYRYRLLDISPVAHDAVVEGMSDGTLVLDARGRIVDLNPSAARILGCSPSEVVGRDFREVMSTRAAPLGGNRGSALLMHCEERGQAHEEVRLGEGSQARHYDLALSGLHDGRGRRTGLLVVLHEITERKLAVERLDRMAHYDALTGLANRTLFYERLSQEVARAKRTSTNGNFLALMFLDLDRFKLINDTLGHDTGDLLLKETARRLKGAVREYDVVARLAGDEFTVILPELSNKRDATKVAERIIESVSRPYLLDGNELLATTSVGICFHPTDGQDTATLVKNADAAMYQAKGAGKNRYEVFAEDVFQDPTKHLEFESELDQAIEENRFILHYQPEVRISTGRMVGVEALIRWEHPERGLLYPGDFIPLAEASGMIFSIERWVLREACRQMRSWQERYPTDTPLTASVNISKRHFMHPNLTGVIHRVLEETGLPPESLILEIKENILHEDAVSATVTLQALKKLGVRLAVDDFGAGYSSLQQLKRFPLDVLKIDGSFVRAFHEREEDCAFVSAIISLAHALGLKPVAKGVENSRQLMQLREMGCEVAQGHYFAGSLSHRATSAFLVADLYY